MSRCGILITVLVLVLALIAGPVSAQGGGTFRPDASPESQALYTLLQANSFPLSCDELDASRAGLRFLAMTVPVPPEVVIEPVETGLETAIPAVWFIPPDAPETPVIVYIHGGAYVAGGMDDAYRSHMARLALETGLRVLAVDYRLAPEHPYPAALEDSLAVFRWLAESVPADQIAIVGDSAGGNLALITLLALRDTGEPLPGAAVLLSPWVNLTGSGLTQITLAEFDPVLTPEGLLSSARCYAGDLPLDDPRISPLFADLAGLPPLLILAGTYEILLADSIWLAHRARAAGVPVTLEVWAGQVHVWPLMSALTPESAAAYAAVGAFVKR